MQMMFAREAAQAADASRVAEMAVAIWMDVGIALSPIIGQPGVDALLKRSLHLARDAYPCLAIVGKDTARPDLLAALQSSLSKQTSEDAVAANLGLLQSFQNLLTSLIGLSLSERLLRPVWETPSSGQAEQDITS